MCYNIVVMCMNLIRDRWNKLEYNDFIDYLFKIRDIEYRDFHSKLGIGDNVIGIRTSILKNMAKDISKGNYSEFLDLLGNNYYEEVTLYGFIICNIKVLEDSVKYLEIYKNKINNWASCDLFCSSYKIVRNNKEYFWKYINDNINNDNLWIRRLCFVLVISYFIEEYYMENIFMLCDQYSTNDYYVQMAVAWLISICYITFPSITIKYIKDNELDDFTHNRAIQKIRDSYRVSSNDKEFLCGLKRK